MKKLNKSDEIIYLNEINISFLSLFICLLIYLSYDPYLTYHDHLNNLSTNICCEISLKAFFQVCPLNVLHLLTFLVFIRIFDPLFTLFDDYWLSDCWKVDAL